MITSGAAPHNGARRILIVEDEVLIGMLLEDMLGDMGYVVAATASRVEHATELARDAEVDAAILDVDLNGHEVFPIAHILADRGVPFMFATGYGERALPPPFEKYPTLQKPFQLEALERQLAQLFPGHS